MAAFSCDIAQQIGKWAVCKAASGQGKTIVIILCAIYFAGTLDHKVIIVGQNETITQQLSYTVKKYIAKFDSLNIKIC